jgi:hypothetical protein
MAMLRSKHKTVVISTDWGDEPVKFETGVPGDSFYYGTVDDEIAARLLHNYPDDYARVEAEPKGRKPEDEDEKPELLRDDDEGDDDEGEDEESPDEPERGETAVHRAPKRKKKRGR